jgi:hypothetical protein
VTSVEADGDPAFQTRPCAGEMPCPWRRDAPPGQFPAEAFRLSAATAYDMAERTFGCHSTGTANVLTCAGFLLRGAGDNLEVRLWDADLSVVASDVELYDSYREMAIANGVAPDDPALTPCRGDGVLWTRLEPSTAPDPKASSIEQS